MPGWAKELAEQIKLQEKLRHEEHERQVKRQKMFAAEAPNLFTQLIAVVESDLKEFNEAFRDDVKRMVIFQRTPPNRFRVRKESYPPISLEVWLELDTQRIEYRLTRKVVHDGSAGEKSGTLGLSMDDEGKISVLHDGRAISLEEASQILLRPVLAP